MSRDRTDLAAENSWMSGMTISAGTAAQFARDSPLEEAVTSQPVSGSAKFPASREFTGNFADSGLSGAPTMAKNARQHRALRTNSLRIQTGSFLWPCREF